MRLISALLGLTCSLLMTPAAQAQTHAQTYPHKPIRIIVAYPAGQGTDIATRYLADQIAKDLGQPIIIDNRPGAGGNLGTDASAKADADGYTLTMGTNATHVLNQFLYAQLTFDAEKNFEPIALVGTFPMVVAVNATSALQSIEDLLAVSRKNSKEADIAIPSTTARLVVELLKERSGAPLFSVPYKGSGNAIADVLGGQVQVIVDTPTALKSQLAGGKLRALGVTSSKPSGLVPGVKPVADQGVAGFEVVAWNALYAPRGTPASVIAVWNAAMNKALARPETRQRLLELGFDPAGGTAANLADFAKAERAKWQPLIKTAGIKLD